MSAKSFRAKLGAKGHSLFFEVPLDVRKEFGKARPPVSSGMVRRDFSPQRSSAGGAT